MVEIFAEQWDGIAITYPRDGDSPAELTSDTSRLQGCGAWSNMAWFRLKWDNHAQLFPTAAKELVPIVTAAAVWGGGGGKHWNGTTICCGCDNQVVAAAINSKSCRENYIRHMLQCLFIIEAQF